MAFGWNLQQLYQLHVNSTAAGRVGDRLLYQGGLLDERQGVRQGSLLVFAGERAAKSVVIQHRQLIVGRAVNLNGLLVDACAGTAPLSPNRPVGNAQNRLVKHQALALSKQYTLASLDAL